MCTVVLFGRCDLVFVSFRPAPLGGAPPFRPAWGGVGSGPWPSGPVLGPSLVLAAIRVLLMTVEPLKA